MHIQILKELATYVKEGRYTGIIGIPKKLVLVGHSFGSVYTNGLLAEDPEIADAAVLTGLGFTMDVGTVTESFSVRIAAGENIIWSGLDAGNVVWDSIYDNVNG